MVRSKKIGGWRKRAELLLVRSGIACSQGGLEKRRDRDKGFPREIGLVKDCDVVLANMWRPSIGTTLSIVRARQRGKPVVLLLSKRVQSPMLEAIVGEANVARTMVDAVARVAAMLKEEERLRSFDFSELAEGNGTEAITRLVVEAASSAGEADVGLEATIVNAIVPCLVAASTRETQSAVNASKSVHDVVSALEQRAFDDQARASYRRVRRELGRLFSHADATASTEGVTVGDGRPVSQSQCTARERVIWEVLLPKLTMLRDSLAHLAALGEERRGILNILKQINDGTNPPNTDRVQSARWFECHYREGSRSLGRVYWKPRGGECLVLVSTKGTQRKKDIEYLRDHD